MLQQHQSAQLQKIQSEIDKLLQQLAIAEREMEVGPTAATPALLAPAAVPQRQVAAAPLLPVATSLNMVPNPYGGGINAKMPTLPTPQQQQYSGLEAPSALAAFLRPSNVAQRLTAAPQGQQPVHPALSQSDLLSILQTVSEQLAGGPVPRPAVESSRIFLPPAPGSAQACFRRSAGDDEQRRQKAAPKAAASRRNSKSEKAGKAEKQSAASAAQVQGAYSVGSALHALGSCRPCAWFWKPGGCNNGIECRHCHSCPPTELKERRRQKVAAGRRASFVF